MGIQAGKKIKEKTIIQKILLHTILIPETSKRKRRMFLIIISMLVMRKKMIMIKLLTILVTKKWKVTKI